MIESSLPPFVQFSDARPGRTTHGCVISVKPYGCLVQFYNNLKGLVPVSELSNEPIANPEDVFYLGQVRPSKSRSLIGSVLSMIGRVRLIE